MFIEVAHVAQWVKYMLCKHADLSPHVIILSFILGRVRMPLGRTQVLWSTSISKIISSIISKKPCPKYWSMEEENRQNQPLSSIHKYKYVYSHHFLALSLSPSPPPPHNNKAAFSQFILKENSANVLIA